MTVFFVFFESIAEYPRYVTTSVFSQKEFTFYLVWGFLQGFLLLLLRKSVLGLPVSLYSQVLTENEELVISEPEELRM